MIKMTKALCLLGLLMLSTACAPTQKNSRPEVPDRLLAEVKVPDREAKTIKDAGLLIVEYHEALLTANSQLMAIGSILRGARQP